MATASVMVMPSAVELKEALQSTICVTLEALTQTGGGGGGGAATNRERRSRVGGAQPVVTFRMVTRAGETPRYEAAPLPYCDA
jgi:hypothetical protein